jgi:tripartite-type tricarboxylate transporter receptor subunit TctC
MQLLIKRALLAVTLALVSLAPLAQQWPGKPVRLIVPYPPAGSVDPLARLLSAKLGESLGQTFIVENRAGAGGSIGTAYTAKVAADGYTFLFVFDQHAVNPALLPKLPFDTLKDFAPIMLVGVAPYAIVAPAGSAFKTFSDAVGAARSKPDSLNFASIGNGTLGHLAMIRLQQAGSFKATHVPFNGGGPMIQALLGEQVELGIGSIALLTPQVKGGKLRALAVAGDKRSHALPDVPTLAELGIPGITAMAWWAVLAPVGVPKPIIERFHAELVKALALPDVRKVLGDSLGMELVVSSPSQLEQFLTDEFSRWGKVVRDNNIRID